MGGCRKSKHRNAPFAPQPKRCTNAVRNAAFTLQPRRYTNQVLTPRSAG